MDSICLFFVLSWYLWLLRHLRLDKGDICSELTHVNIPTFPLFLKNMSHITSWPADWKNCFQFSFLPHFVNFHLFLPIYTFFSLLAHPPPQKNIFHRLKRNSKSNWAFGTIYTYNIFIFMLNFESLLKRVVFLRLLGQLQKMTLALNQTSK